jgi:two-component system sensor histidine kinase/response regulator
MDNYLISEPKASIMLVDDTLDNLRLLTQLLGIYYRVRPFQSGIQALEAARLAPPDLILLDIMMPEMNGFEVIKQFRLDPRLIDIPVIFLSALDDVKDKIQAFEAGGVDYVTKPFQEQEVLARVRTHLALYDLQRQLQIANRGLALQLNELQERNQELDAFAHTVAHDLKNPLAAIILSAQMMLDTLPMKPEDQMIRDLARIVGIGVKMDRALEGLMLLSGLRNQQVELEPLDMGAVVAEAVKSLDLLIEQYNAEIVLPDSWPLVLGYAPWVEEVWVNYISNAIKYGGSLHEGIPPHVDVGYEKSINSPENQIRFWVRDNGIGLTINQQQRLFVPFERIQTVRVEGHGLGLSIVRRIVEKLGGQVGVESAVGQGSTFYFTLFTN